MREYDKPKFDQSLTFKQMLEAQKSHDNIYQLSSQEMASNITPSKTEYFKYATREYFRFLLDPTLITGHIIKVGICIALLVYMSQANVMPDLPKIKNVLESFLALGIGFVIVTSATRSMLMPLAAIVLSIATDLVTKDVTFLAKIDPLIMQYLLATGICGICVAVFFRPSTKFYQ